MSKRLNHFFLVDQMTLDEKVTTNAAAKPAMIEGQDIMAVLQPSAIPSVVDLAMLSENVPQSLGHKNAISEAQSFDKHVFFLLQWNPDPESGLGGWGNLNTDARVLNSAFLHTSRFQLSYPYPHTLTCNFTLQPFLDYPEAETWHVVCDKMANVSFSPQSIKKMINGWIDRLPTSLFTASWIFGQKMLITPLTSTLAMEMMDKIWYKWQLKHPENLNTFSSGSKAAIIIEETEMYPVGMPPDLNVNLFSVLSLIT
ncbi:hypothetical protein C0995_013142 [Termitomyces sp. Mi166|nr:hypothetical protein C0995_013142 [Termitomyces sp. Mi166\